MSGTCTHCDGAVEWKDEGGAFRSFCESCAQAVADERDPNPDLAVVSARE